jgi:hypothetical protein
MMTIPPPDDVEATLLGVGDLSFAAVASLNVASEWGMTAVGSTLSALPG